MKDIVRSTKGVQHDEAVLLATDEGGYPEMFEAYCKQCDLELAVPLSYSTFLRLKPWEITSNEKQECCVCVYHVEVALLIKAINRSRRILHTLESDKGMTMNQSKATSEFLGKSNVCQHAPSCECKCRVCSVRTVSLSQFMDTFLCPRLPLQRFYNLKCVKGLCEFCGWGKFQGTCPADEANKDQDVTVKLLRNVSVDFNGKSKKIKQETTVTTTLGLLLEEGKSVFRGFAEHDFVARWQAHQYRKQREELKDGEYMLVVDFIENYRMCSKVEMQQDYYSKTAVTILVIMLIRRRRENETYQDPEVFSL